MFERPTRGERAVLVHLTFRHLSEQADLQEFGELAFAAGFKSVVQVTSQREKPDPKFFIGKGKLDEILQEVTLHQAEIVIFNHELTPSQERNIERYIKCRVLSRTGLILEIFALRAKTFEGKLQVELAFLEHMSTRLVRGWTHLERQKGGIGLRGGPGETQLEVDRRLLRTRVLAIEKRLEKVRKQRQQSRRARQRSEVPTIALVGYTNAGKSTLFNSLTGSHAWVANQLFATLDPTIRSLELPVVGKAVLVDTVGFIKQLPHTLVDAFRATLEETCQASLLLHVIDASDPHYEDKIEQVNQVLAEIDAQDVPQLQVFNKIDLLTDKNSPEMERDSQGKITKVWVSALHESGLNLLREALQGRLNLIIVQGELHLLPQQGQIRSQLYELQAISREVVNQDGGWDLVIQTTKYHWEKLCQEHSGLSEALKVLKEVKHVLE